jgi:hypothetical protein
MSHDDPYKIHPNPAKEHMVLTPDGGVIECKHEAAAKRLCTLLNELHNQNERLTQIVFDREYPHPGSEQPSSPGLYVRVRPDGSEMLSRWDGEQWYVGESLVNVSSAQALRWREL